jgi:hypothetical protein
LPSTAVPEATAVRSGDPPPQGVSESASLNLTSDLQETRVSVDGVSVGRTPIASLKRASGKHTVTFVSTELGENLSRTVDLKAGETLRVVAQFTRADPTITVRH